MYHLNTEKVAEYKEVFQLFDKDEDGVMSFTELRVCYVVFGTADYMSRKV